MKITWVIFVMLTASLVAEDWEKDPDPKDVAAVIQSIVYSDRTAGEIERDLRPYIRLGDTMKEVEERCGLWATFGFATGPGIFKEIFFIGTEPDIGLLITINDVGGTIVRLSRSEKEIGGVKFPDGLIAHKNVKLLKEYDGYMRQYVGKKIGEKE